MKRPPSDRYIAVLEPGAGPADLPAVAQALSQPLTSSAQLGSRLRAQDVYARGGGIYFKNLGLVVVEGLDDRTARSAARGRSPVRFVERDRVVRAFDPVSPARPRRRRAAEDDWAAALAGLRGDLASAEARVELLERLLGGTPGDDDDGPPPPEPRTGAMTWGLRAVGIEQAGTLTGAGVRVAVLDTGIDGRHPDLPAHLLEGKSFVAGAAWDDDRHGHGTHCCGTVAGGRSSDNGQHFGVAPGAELLVARVLGPDGSGTTAGIVDALDWALERGARVASLSLGAPVDIGEAPSPLYEAVGERAMAAGMLIVAASGNGSRRPHEVPRPVSSPANASTVLAVGALDERLRIAPFSNAGINAADGGRLDLTGPGVNVYSLGSTTAPGGRRYVEKTGTSMATPHVAGLAALCLEDDPGLTAAELWRRLERECRPLPDELPRDVGAGLAQAPRA